MNAEIIAVGSEMLTPEKVDTNSLFLTHELNTLGIEVVAKAIIGDDRLRLTAAISTALATSKMLILTGGLGPTEDDVTRDAAAISLGVGQTLNQEAWRAILDRFQRFGRVPTENNMRQAMILDGAEMLPNANGTAPGQFIVHDGHVLILLPGPPRELKPMMRDQVVPRLKRLIPPLTICTRWYRVSLMPESELDSLIAPIYTKVTNPQTTVLAAAGDIDVHLRARAETQEEAEALLAAIGDPIQALLGDRVYSTNGDPLEVTVGKLLRARGETVAVAESATGGLLGAQFTDVPGSSDYFRGGFLTYSDDLKHRLLGVPAEMLERFSAVSEEVAGAMAEGARIRTGATYAISVTGYADGEFAGTIFVGLSTPKHTHVRALRLTGDRQRVRQMTVVNALDWLRRTLIL